MGVGKEDKNNVSLKQLRPLRLILIAIIPIQFIVYGWLANYPEFVDRWYSNGLFLALSKALVAYTKWTTFPFGQFALVFFSISILLLLIHEIRVLIHFPNSKRKTLLNIALNGFSVFSIFYLLLNFLWALNYRRIPLAQKLDLGKIDMSQVDLIPIAKDLIGKSNSYRKEIGVDLETLPMTNRQILDEAIDGYVQLNRESPIFPIRPVSVKEVLLPDLMTWYGISGIYFPFSGEAFVNTGRPNYLTPATASHELAHQLGIGSESEANFLAFLTCSMHPNISFKYSGNLMAMRYVMRAISRTDTAAYNLLVDEIDEIVLEDLRRNREYHNQFHNPLEPLTELIYDQFLKANKQQAGIASYGQMVDLLVAYYESSSQDSTRISE